MKTPVSLLLRGRYLFTFLSFYSRFVFMLLLWSQFTTSSTAQIKLWDKTYGGNRSDKIASVQQTSDGGYILGGSSNSDISGDKSEANRGVCTDENCSTDYWVIKLNVNGSKTWDKTIGGNKKDELRRIQQTDDGGYILTGFSNSDKSGDKADSHTGIWMVKLKPDGTKVWDKTFSEDEFSFLQPTNDGGLILGGITYSESSSYDYWVSKLNADGSKVWEKTFGGDSQDLLSSLITTPDGGYLLGGSSYSNKSGDKSEPRKSNCYKFSEPCNDYWVIKINAAGKKQWDKTYGGYAEDRLTTMSISPDGGYLVGGISESDKSLDRSEPTRDETENYDKKGDFWIIKIKADGTKVWDKAYGGNRSDELASLLKTPDGGYLLSGYSRSAGGGDMGIRRSIGSIWVLKIDIKGNKLWDTNVESGPQLALTSDSNILLANTNNEYRLANNDDYWLVKLQIPNKKVQTITFYPPDQALTNSPYTLLAKTNSGLPVTFKLISGPATQKGQQLRFTGYGTVVVKAFQAGNDSYSPVEYTTSFQVQRLPKKQDKTIGSDGADILADMVATPEGGYLLAGTSASGISGDKSMASKGSSDYWLVKVDKNKNKVWDKSFGGKGAETISIIIAATDGGYLLGGSSSSGKEGDKSEVSKGASDYWLVKVDATGKKLWDKTIGGNQEDNLTTIITTPDGGYLLGGYSRSGKSADKSESNKGRPDAQGSYSPDYWVVKIDSKGKKIWDKTFGITEADSMQEDRLTSIITTPDGGYLLGGTSGFETGDVGAQGVYWIIKIDAHGQQLWDKTYARDYYSKLSDLVSTPDGGYLLAGVSSFEPSVYWIVKTDGKGNKIWDRTYGGGSILPCAACEINSSTPVEILLTPLGHYLLAGYTYSDQGGDRSEENRGREDYWLVEIDGNGQKIVDKSFGARNSDKLTAIIAAPNGRYLLGGYSNSTSSYEKSENSKGNYDFWLVETEISIFPPSTLEAWNLRYGGSNSDYLTTVVKTLDGGYLLGGYSYSPKSGDKSQNGYGKSDYWVVKTDAAGAKLWDKRYGGTGEDYLKSIVGTPDGGFLLGGGSESGSSGNKTASSKGGRDIWVVKISNSGEKVWDQSYGGSGTEDLQKITVLSDMYGGTYLLAGYSDSPVSGDKTQASQGGLDYWLVKLDGQGSKEWDERYGGKANDYVGDLLVLENGDLLVGGTSFSSRSGDRSQASQGSSDYWLLRTNSEGKKRWDKRYGGTDQDQLMALLRPNKNTILLAGYSASGKYGDKSQDSQGGKDFWLVQVNSSGDKQWDKTYGGREEETLRSLISDKDGGYVLGGTSFSGKGGDKSQPTQGASDYWLVKTNNKGEKFWDKRLGGSREEELRTVWTTEEGGYILGGRSSSGVSGDRTQPSQGENDFWLVKVDPEAIPIIAEREVNQEKEPTTELSPMMAYPNPTLGEVTVRFTLPQTQSASVKVYDNQGREITTLFQGEVKAEQTYEVEWQAANNTAGMYLLRLDTARKSHMIKLLLTH
ncbi:T9SS type A sorting domain-containing protein [Adhaeribacter radiodurans]|uniref:T9SS type A sorting domain-containing protein n=1 Tax=Adhaeribacter radiodurans TaxID=2745197 RepID=A0A7L7L7K1_9BACT|nr:T9SS type A sorting domain-containing protein [Adhaeribacter radiodurans]QMU28778.1 T9SS type A sorting domain-containing protein [Adhaeribacter radiodurans]